jgi:hypothetical protein
MDLQAIHDAISEQKLIMQRLERNMRRIEDSYGRVSSRLDALETKAEMPPKDTGDSPRFRRAHTGAVPQREQTEGTEKVDEKVDDKPEGTPDDSVEKKERATALTARVKSAIRSSLQDGSVNDALDKFQASVKLTDEATGALSEIASLVKASLDQDQGVMKLGSMPVPGGSLSLLLEMAKTSQFQRFIANVVAQALKEAEA